MKFPTALYRFALSLIALLCVGTSNVAMADGEPTQFVRVTTLNELTDNAWYLIGTINPKTGKFYLMRAENDGKSKIKAVHIASPVEGEPIKASNMLHFWRFDVNRDGSSLQIAISDAKGQNVVAQSTTAADLCLDNSKPTEWVVTTAENGCFHFQHPSSQRYISLSATTLSYFGNYVDELKDLYIYKSVDDFTEVPGKQTLPNEDAIYTIKSNGYVSTSALSPISCSAYELYNGGIAYSTNLSRMRAYVIGDLGTFTMANEDSGAYLNYDIQWSDAPALWTVVNGHIATTENPTRFLVYDKGVYAVYTSAEIKKSTLATEAAFAALGEKPFMEMSESGVLTLRGGWQGSALAKTEMDGVRAIDATGIILPRQAVDFNETPNPNVPIYVPAEQKDYTPEGWKFVAIKGGNSYSLLKTAVLQDRSDLYLPYPIHITSSSNLTYVREAYVDGKWETLYLPFSANIPDGFEAYKFESVSDGAVKLKKVASIPSCTPMLIRSTNAESGSKSVTFKATGDVVTTDSKQEGIFKGTFSPLVFSESEQTYLLESTGEAFILVDNGSRLSPFRCFIRTESSQGIRFMINVEETTGMQSPIATDLPESIYDLSGKCLKKAPRGGVYIHNHQKILSTK